MRAALRRRLVTLGVPVAAHGLLLWLVAGLAARARPGEPAAAFVTLAHGLHALGEAARRAVDEAERAAPALVDLAVESERLPPEWLPPPAVARPVGAEAARADVVAAPRVADGDEPRAPRPDRGAPRAGLPAGEAFGASHERAESRLTDGAQRSVPARTRIGDDLSSPSAERRAPRDGLDPGDGPGAPALAGARSRPVTSAGDDGARARLVPAGAAPFARAGPGDQATRAGAPVVRAGTLAVESDVRGPAVDRHDRAGASAESAPTPLAAHRPGPVRPVRDEGVPDGARSPGAVASATTGDAPALHGAPVPAPQGPVAQWDGDAEPPRPYLREIQRRTAEVLRFPPRLALALHQGESIVRFKVGRDGRIHGPVDLVKSSGFEEFDDEARAAPLRAAPFARPPEAVVVTLRLAFRNPLVR